MSSALVNVSTIPGVPYRDLVPTMCPGKIEHTHGMVVKQLHFVFLNLSVYAIFRDPGSQQRVSLRIAKNYHEEWFPVSYGTDGHLV